MYETVLWIHSWLRWVVLIAGLLAVVRGSGGWSGTKPWMRADDRAGAIFVGTLDLQMLLGLLLYIFLSPFSTAAFRDFGGAMGNSAMRFWAVEHLFGMVIAIVLAHVGRARSRKAPSARKHRTAAIFYTLALIVILASIPWPGTPAGRVLFRW
jgi:hypothetical protein